MHPVFFLRYHPTSRRRSFLGKLSLPHVHVLCGKAFHTFAGSHDKIVCLYFTLLFLFQVLILLLCIFFVLVQFFASLKSAKVVFSRSLKCSTLIAPSFSNSRDVFVQIRACSLADWRPSLLQCTSVFLPCVCSFTHIFNRSVITSLLGHCPSYLLFWNGNN